MAGLGFNKVILMGDLTQDPELKMTQSGISFCNFSVAVNRRTAKADQAQQTVDFINVVAWRQTAEFICRYFKKGQPILINGQLQTRTWNDNQTGQKRYATEVSADEVYFTSSAAQSGGAANQNAGNNAYTPDAYGTPSFNSAQSASFEEIPNDESLPF
jgi:single-strand DNA-binding protein